MVLCKGCGKPFGQDQSVCPFCCRFYRIVPDVKDMDSQDTRPSDETTLTSTSIEIYEESTKQELTTMHLLEDLRKYLDSRFDQCSREANLNREMLITMLDTEEFEIEMRTVRKNIKDLAGMNANAIGEVDRKVTNIDSAMEEYKSMNAQFTHSKRTARLGEHFDGALPHGEKNAVSVPWELSDDKRHAEDSEAENVGTQAAQRRLLQSIIKTEDALPQFPQLFDMLTSIKGDIAQMHFETTSLAASHSNVATFQDEVALMTTSLKDVATARSDANASQLNFQTSLHDIVASSSNPLRTDIAELRAGIILDQAKSAGEKEKHILMSLATLRDEIASVKISIESFHSLKPDVKGVTTLLGDLREEVSLLKATICERSPGMSGENTTALPLASLRSDIEWLTPVRDEIAELKTCFDVKNAIATSAGRDKDERLLNLVTNVSGELQNLRRAISEGMNIATSVNALRDEFVLLKDGDRAVSTSMVDLRNDVTSVKCAVDVMGSIFSKEFALIRKDEDEKFGSVICVSAELQNLRRTISEGMNVATSVNALRDEVVLLKDEERAVSTSMVDLRNSVKSVGHAVDVKGSNFSQELTSRRDEAERVADSIAASTTLEIHALKAMISECAQKTDMAEVARVIAKVAGDVHALLDQKHETANMVRMHDLASAVESADKKISDISDVFGTGLRELRAILVKQSGIFAQEVKYLNETLSETHVLELVRSNFAEMKVSARDRESKIDTELAGISAHTSRLCDWTGWQDKYFDAVRNDLRDIRVVVCNNGGFSEVLGTLDSMRNEIRSPMVQRNFLEDLNDLKVSIATNKDAMVLTVDDMKTSILCNVAEVQSAVEEQVSSRNIDLAEDFDTIRGDIRGIGDLVVMATVKMSEQIAESVRSANEHDIQKQVAATADFHNPKTADKDQILLALAEIKAGVSGSRELICANKDLIATIERKQIKDKTASGKLAGIRSAIKVLESNCDNPYLDSVHPGPSIDVEVGEPIATNTPAPGAPLLQHKVEQGLPHETGDLLSAIFALRQEMRTELRTTSEFARKTALVMERPLDLSRIVDVMDEHKAELETDLTVVRDEIRKHRDNGPLLDAFGEHQRRVESILICSSCKRAAPPQDPSHGRPLDDFSNSVESGTCSL